MTSTLDHPQGYRKKGPQPMHIHPYINHQQRRQSKRPQEISRDRERLMELIQNIPEECFELSLKDIVEKQYLQGSENAPTVVAEKETKTDDHANRSMIKATKNSSQKNNLLKRGSMSREHVALKMFILSPRRIKSGSKLPSAPKISPIYHLVPGGFDRGWWKKKFSTEGEIKTSKSVSLIKSSSCNRSSRFAVCVFGCWSYFDTKE